MKKKIIIDAPGQTCNRFWSYVALISEAISNNTTVAILFFDIAIESFPNFINSKHIELPFYSRHLIKYLGIKNYLSIIKKLFYNRFTFKFTNLIFSKKGTVVNGWDYRGESIDFKKNKNELKRIFTPDIGIMRTIQDKFSKIKENHSFIVGVHIRRRDYRTWLDGQYFYELDDYYKIMQYYQKSLNKDVCFFISSDEKIDISKFKGLHCEIHENSSAILDLYSLSKCDRIIGPLSTYSRWASFYGDVPLHVFERNVFDINDENFSVVKSLYMCANGKEFTNWTEKEKNSLVKC